MIVDASGIQNPSKSWRKKTHKKRHQVPLNLGFARVLDMNVLVHGSYSKPADLTRPFYKWIGLWRGGGCNGTTSLRIETAPELEDAGTYCVCIAIRVCLDFHIMSSTFGSEPTFLTWKLIPNSMERTKRGKEWTTSCHPTVWPQFFANGSIVSS